MTKTIMSQKEKNIGIVSQDIVSTWQRRVKPNNKQTKKAKKQGKPTTGHKKSSKGWLSLPTESYSES